MGEKGTEGTKDVLMKATTPVMESHLLSYDWLDCFYFVFIHKQTGNLKWHSNLHSNHSKTVKRVKH